MSDQESRGRDKRPRDESPDSQTRNESIVTRRNRINRNQTIESLATYSRLSATYTVRDLEGRQRTYPSQAATMAFKDDAAATISRYGENTLVVWSSSVVEPEIDPATNPQGAQLRKMRLERERRLERSFSLYSKEAREIQAKDPSKCKICFGTHKNEECIYLNMGDVDFDETDTAFREWCPFHKRPHPMDTCRQLHLWAQDPEQVHRLLITNAADAPAFATDLISWPDIVRDTDRAFPWSAKYSHRMWNIHMLEWTREQSRGPITSYRGPDSATTHHENRQKLPYQTASGNAPKFRGPRALEELATFARAQQQNLEQDKRRGEQTAREEEARAKLAKLEAEATRIRERLQAEAARFSAERAKILEQFAKDSQAAATRGSSSQATQLLANSFKNMHVRTAALAPAATATPAVNAPIAEHQEDTQMEGADPAQQPGLQDLEVGPHDIAFSNVLGRVTKGEAADLAREANESVGPSPDTANAPVIGVVEPNPGASDGQVSNNVMFTFYINGEITNPFAQYPQL
ncbi:hypothetical protein F4803DRAFT_249090 [Xylaria telfairii]|nr:hypothetical protein F4803DRAFT_249090 [Xylaria telfairii]